MISVILYSAKWCAPCQEFKKQYWNSLQKEFQNVEFRIVDIDKEKVKIASIPRIAIEDEGQVVKVFKKVFSEIDSIISLLEDICYEDSQ
jgi:thiol-disulfide isomerase/thioredoxin